MMVLSRNHRWRRRHGAFLERHQNRVVGVLSGFDRVLFQGTLRSLSYLNGLEAFLATFRVLYKDFGNFWEGLSNQLKAHAHALAEKQGAPFNIWSRRPYRKRRWPRRFAIETASERG